MPASRPAFLAPSLAAPRRPPALHAPRCCATSPPPPPPPERAGVQSPAAAGGARENTSAAIPHETWRIYDRADNACVICLGTGKCKCLYCFGDGVVFVGPARRRDQQTCPQCEGRQRETCPRCRGSGIRPSTRLDPATGEFVANRTNQEVREGLPAGAGAAAAAGAGAGEGGGGGVTVPAQAPAATEPGAVESNPAASGAAGWQ